MLLFNVGGYILDTGTSVSLSLTRKNNAFNFGDLELTRSVSFKVPTTPMNDKIFTLAKDYHYTGAKARVQMATQMQYDGGVADGYLYISQCSGTEYECVFIFGDLTPLKAMSADGKIADHYVLTDTDKAGIAMDTYFPANYGISLTFDNLSYLHSEGGNTYLNPSIRLKDLIKDMYSVYGIDYKGYTGDDKIRVILDKVNDAELTDTITMSFDSDTGTITKTDQKNIFAVTQVTNYCYRDNGSLTFTYQSFTLGAYNKVTLKFPDNFSSDYFLMYYKQNDASSKETIQKKEFFGGYSFDTEYYDVYGFLPTDRAITGQPLAGKEVELSKYDSDGNIITYNFFRRSGFRNDSGAGFNVIGFAETIDKQIVDWSLTTNYIKAPIEYYNANRAYLKDNIPDYTYLDIVKMLAVIGGYYITYGIDGTTSRPTIYLNGISPSGWSIQYLDKVIKTEAINRTFKDWKKHNYIMFDNEDYVGSPLKIDYTINNAVLEDEGEVYKFGESEGIKNNYNTYDAVYLQDFTKDDDGTISPSAGKKTLALEDFGIYLGYIQQATGYMRKLAELQQLCTQSTQIKATIIMTLADFNNLKENILLWYDGCKWVWTEAQWNKGQATLTLQKYA